MRDTLAGQLLYTKFLTDEQKKKGTDLHINVIHEMYIKDVLNLSPHYVTALSEILQELFEKYEKILEYRNGLDDNKAFLTIGLENWIPFCEGKQTEILSNNIV